MFIPPFHDSGCSKKVSKNKKWTPFTSHQRVAPGLEGDAIRKVLFKSSAVDISGNPIGPLVIIQDIEKIQKTNGSIDKFLEIIDQKDPYAKHCDKIIEIYKTFVDRLTRERCDEKLKRNNRLKRKWMPR
mmetsp:Transcript_23845/g.56301  ORF Transcript_23845/g.56301 Transcript_23845/m.56301 type:complete len:129 (+) Transcript_23845:658-1044(+)